LCAVVAEIPTEVGILRLNFATRIFATLFTRRLPKSRGKEALVNPEQPWKGDTERRGFESIETASSATSFKTSRRPVTGQRWLERCGRVPPGFSIRSQLPGAHKQRRSPEMPRSGHFAASDAPDQLAEDIRKFFRNLIAG